ncbi:hypothetical protein LTR08_004287 [Meristemomyces frigidus]|nr:hypothetical protein LTR08_004287 [Meristemomyces frigidus]
MEQSPLTQQTRPDVFEPKVVGLYKHLFQVNYTPSLIATAPLIEPKDANDDEIPDGFWHELFLLNPSLPQLRQVLLNTDPDYLLHNQHQPQQLLLQAIAHLKTAHPPADGHALDTLTVFFAAVLSKRYSHPSSDIIEVLAGLDQVDAVFTDLVATLERIIRDGQTLPLRQKAVRTAIAVVSGGYHTALVSYFIHRDLFPALMKLVHQLDSPLQAAEPLLLTGLLANYNKFEVHNPYRVRFADLINDDTMENVVESIAWTCTLLRSRYIAIQDDTPVGWSVSGTLSYVGLGVLAGAKPALPVLTEEQQRDLFAEQPAPESATLLTLYDFTLANKIFRHHLVTQPSSDKSQAAPFSALLSFTSYLYQHAHRSTRAGLYAYLTLLTLLILVEDPSTAKLLCETSAPAVRLCRQRPPYLPLPKPAGGERAYAAVLLDLLIDALNHNLRKRLDTAFYLQLLITLSRLLTYLAKSRTKLQYHWSELWRSLLSFLRFLNQYAEDLQPLQGAREVTHAVAQVLALALTSGEAFLPEAKDYDDLFYKLVESGDALAKFRDTYFFSSTTPTITTTATAVETRSRAHVETLVGVSKHYQTLIESERAKREHLTPREVSKIIKQGYETLSLESAQEGGGGQLAHDGFREVEHKVELKRIARVVVGDAGVSVSASV